MNLLAPINVYPVTVVAIILILIGLMALVRMHSRQAHLWQATSKAIAKQAYDKGRSDEAKHRSLPLDARVAEAYHRGIRDSTREWIRMLKERGLNVRLTSESEFEIFEKRGTASASATQPAADEG